MKVSEIKELFANEIPHVRANAASTVNTDLERRIKATEGILERGSLHALSTRFNYRKAWKILDTVTDLLTYNQYKRLPFNTSFEKRCKDILKVSNSNKVFTAVMRALRYYYQAEHWTLLVNKHGWADLGYIKKDTKLPETNVICIRTGRKIRKYYQLTYDGKIKPAFG